MPERPRIDEFVFILLAGLALIIIFMFSWTVPPEEVVNVTVPKVGEIPYLALHFPEEVEVKYAIGVEKLDSKKNVEVVSGLFAQEEVNLVAIISGEKLADIREAFIVITIDSTNKLMPVIVTVNEKEVYRDTPDVGTIYIPVEKNFLKSKNIIKIRTEFPGLLKFWQKSRYKLELAEFKVSIFGLTFKDFEFFLEKQMVKYFKFGKLEYEIIDRVGEKGLIVKINEQQVLKGFHEIRKHERIFGPAVVTPKEGKNVLSFSAEPDVTYVLKDITLTIVYERR